MPDSRGVDWSVVSGIQDAVAEAHFEGVGNSQIDRSRRSKCNLPADRDSRVGDVAPLAQTFGVMAAQAWMSGRDAALHTAVSVRKAE